jgi:hypothetical protein
MLLDVFRADAFNFTRLVAAINKIPYVPTRLGDLGLFNEQGVNTLSVAIELRDGALSLVPAAARGAPGPAKNLQRRVIKDFRMTHLPQQVAVMADEVQGLRAFGSENETETAMNYLTQKLVVARRDLDLTHEWQRMGALKGQVLDADGTTVLYDYFTEFGLTPLTQTIALSVSTTKTLQSITQMKRSVENKLGGVQMSGLRVLCSDEFFDALTGNAAVQTAYQFQMSQFLRDDNRQGFEFGGVIWENYRGTVNGTRFIAANKAYAIPLGVPDLFNTYYAPAPYIETVGTIGLPFYVKPEDMDYGVGINYQVQSNPLHICTRPDCVVQLTAS